MLLNAEYGMKIFQYVHTKLNSIKIRAILAIKLVLMQNFTKLKIFLILGQ